MALPSPERLTVARELHDGIAQDLVGIGYSLDLLLAEPSLDRNARSQIRNTRLEVDGLISKVRSEILNLRSPENKSLASSIRSIAQACLNGISCTYTLEDVVLEPTAISELLAITIEILRNVTQHSRASHVAIDLYPVNNRTCLEIRDNGIGGAQMIDGHFGLSGIIERVHALQGSITIESNEGTHIALLI